MRSMTAYSAAEEKNKSGKIKIVLRSLNFKYLDVSFFNLPQHALGLEEKIREEVKKAITRGKIEVYLYQDGGRAGSFQINKERFGSYARQLKALTKEFKLNKEIDALDILGLPGVVSAGGEKSISKTRVLFVLKKALERLIKFKEEKGKAIKKELLKNLNLLDVNIEKIKRNKKKSLGEEESREDIDEEIALIIFYSKKLKQTINAKRQVRKGKGIDFLSQEVLRELNASASKTRDQFLANLIVEAKNYLGRIREQAQNIE